MNELEVLEAKVAALQQELAALEDERDTLLAIIDEVDKVRKTIGSNEDWEEYDELRATVEDYDVSA